jgi:putative PIN family toxin of toxin-antitoxin system
MKIIVDTNVLVSAIIRDNIPEQAIMWIISQPIIEWIATAKIVQEYKEVLQRKKFKLPSDVLDSWFRLFDEELVLVSPKMEVNFPRDVKDAKFLECALESQADVFITGDRDFSEAQALIATQIMSVSQFKLFIGKL